MAAFPIEVVFGLYLGLLTGVIPALVAWVLGFVVRYLTGVTIPSFGVVVLGLAIAGVNGGLLALSDETVIGAVGSGVPVAVAIVVIVMMTLYAHSKGDGMAAAFPKRVSLRSLRERTLSADVVELVGGTSEATVEVHGDVGDVEGYPPLPGDLRERIRGAEWTFPGDLPLSELERRVADRLRTEFDLAHVTVRVDERGRATVAAAPPVSGLSRRVPAGKRAVSVDALLPTGVAAGDRVELVAGGEDEDEYGGDRRVAGEVVSARADGEEGWPTAAGGAAGTAAPPADPTAASAGNGDGDGHLPTAPAAPTTAGGEGRLTVAVSPAEARTLLAGGDRRVIVESRGVRREFELLSVLRRAGKRIRRLTVRGGALEGAALGAAHVRERYGVAVLAVRSDGDWRVAPGGDVRIAAGDELYVVGSRGALEGFAEVVG